MKQPSITFFSGMCNALDAIQIQPSSLPSQYDMTDQCVLASHVPRDSYISIFIPSTSTQMTLMHELLHADAEITWSRAYQVVFQCVKEHFCADVTLCYCGVN